MRDLFRGGIAWWRAGGAVCLAIALMGVAVGPPPPRPIRVNPAQQLPSVVLAGVTVPAIRTAADLARFRQLFQRACGADAVLAVTITPRDGVDGPFVSQSPAEGQRLLCARPSLALVARPVEPEPVPSGPQRPPPQPPSQQPPPLEAIPLLLVPAFRSEAAFEAFVDRAETLCRQAVESRVTRAESTRPAGTVVGQRPWAGRPFACGSALELMVSEGPRQLTVPPLENAAEVRTFVAEAARFCGEVPAWQVAAEETTDAPAGTPLRQQPEAGASYACAEPVTLWLAAAPAPSPPPPPPPPPTKRPDPPVKAPDRQPPEQRAARLDPPPADPVPQVPATDEPSLESAEPAPAAPVAEAGAGQAVIAADGASEPPKPPEPPPDPEPALPPWLVPLAVVALLLAALTLLWRVALPRLVRLAVGAPATRLVSAGDGPGLPIAVHLARGTVRATVEGELEVRP